MVIQLLWWQSVSSGVYHSLFPLGLASFGHSEGSWMGIRPNLVPLEQITWTLAVQEPGRHMPCQGPSHGETLPQSEGNKKQVGVRGGEAKMWCTVSGSSHT